MKNCRECKVELTEATATPSAIARNGRCRSCESDYRDRMIFRKMKITDAEITEAFFHFGGRESLRDALLRKDLGIHDVMLAIKTIVSAFRGEA